MNSTELIIFIVTTAFMAGGVYMTTRFNNKRMDTLERHNDIQDQQIAETHTTSQVILVKLDNIGRAIAELREDSRKSGATQND